VHDVVKRRLAETPPLVVVLASPNPGAEMLAVILISVLTEMVAVNNS
jgi:hypothetical protein